MKLLIDANILLDVLQDRQPHVAASAAVWKLCEVGQAEGVVSALTLANLVYIMRKELDPARIEVVLQQLSLIFTVADLHAEDLRRAAGLQWSDFEDAVQSVTASRVGADYLITRNCRDFAASAVSAVTPADLLSM